MHDQEKNGDFAKADNPFFYYRFVDLKHIFFL